MWSKELKRHRIGTVLLTILLCFIAPVLVHTNSVTVADSAHYDMNIVNERVINK